MKAPRSPCYKLTERASIDAQGQYYDLCWSIGGLTAFWVVGAAIFQAIEGWSYGNAFYFNIVFNLTIGEISKNDATLCISADDTFFSGYGCA